MYIGSSPTRTDAERLATFHRLSDDVRDQVQGLLDEDAKDYDARLANALAAARAEGVELMALLMWPHENFAEILDAALERFDAGSEPQRLLAISADLQGSSVDDLIDDIEDDSLTLPLAEVRG